jgi:chromosome condensin MukBEF ATPase and DNA-binding subunit MukB
MSDNENARLAVIELRLHEIEDRMTDKFHERDEQMKLVLHEVSGIREAMADIKNLLVGVLGSEGLVKRVQDLEEETKNSAKKMLYITGFCAALYLLLKEKLKTIGLLP